MTTTTFKVGDRVRLISLADGYGGEYTKSTSNTIGNVGVITRNAFGFFDVTWDNGSSNNYCDHNLEHEVVFEVGTRVKLVNLDDGMGGTFYLAAHNTVGNVGTIASDKDSDGMFYVRWDNETSAYYYPHNLEVYTEELVAPVPSVVDWTMYTFQHLPSDEKRKLIAAHMRGETIQQVDFFGDWEDCTSPTWDDYSQYRIKPPMSEDEKRLINVKDRLETLRNTDEILSARAGYLSEIVATQAA